MSGRVKDAAELRGLVEKMAVDPDRNRICNDQGCNSNCWPLCGCPTCPRFKSIVKILLERLG